MKYEKSLYKVTPKDFKRKFDYGLQNASTTVDINLVVFGIFDTSSVKWTYFITSVAISTNSSFISSDVHGSSRMNQSFSPLSIYGIETYGLQVKTKEEGIKWIDEFKMKWETGSNDLVSEQRDKKLNEILK